MIDSHEDIQPKLSEIKSLESVLHEVMDKKDHGLVAVKETVVKLEEDSKKRLTDLKNAKDNLKDRVNKTVNFQAKTKEFDEWLQATNSELKTTVDTAEDSDKLKAHLSKLEELQDEAITNKSLVDDVNKSGKSLAVHCKNENKVKASVLGKVEEVEDSYANVVSRINMEHGRIQKLLLKTQDFDVTLSEFFVALEAIEERSDKLKPLDARFEELRLVKQENEVGIQFIEIRAYFI